MNIEYMEAQQTGNIAGTSLQEKMAALDPDRQARIKNETDHLQGEYKSSKNPP